MNALLGWRAVEVGEGLETTEYREFPRADLTLFSALSRRPHWLHYIHLVDGPGFGGQRAAASWSDPELTSADGLLVVLHPGRVGSESEAETLVGAAEASRRGTPILVVINAIDQRQVRDSVPLDVELEMTAERLRNDFSLAVRSVTAISSRDALAAREHMRSARLWRVQPSVDLDACLLRSDGPPSWRAVKRLLHRSRYRDVDRVIDDFASDHLGPRRADRALTAPSEPRPNRTAGNLDV